MTVSHTIGRVAAILGVTLVCATGCRQEPTGSPKPTPARQPLVRAEGFNVVLITIDTTRADHLGCYGNDIVKTPNLDRFASEGARFEQCISVAPITLPSHTSIMTSTYPFVHGVRANGAFRVPAANLTLAEIMRAHGYRTGAQVAAFVMAAQYGLNQGFDDYVDVDVAPDALMPGGEAVEAGGWAGRRQWAERRGDKVRAGAVDWLRAHASDKFFLWVHFFDPHQPYDPPEPYKTGYRSPYSGEIAYVDDQIGQLRKAMEDIGVADRTLVCVVADHGEGLGEHNEMTHLSFVYDTTVRVPLILWCPGRVPAGSTIGAQVRTIDVTPTLLDMVALPPKPDAEGTSLVPLLDGSRTDLDLPAYAETFVPKFMFQFSATRCLRAGGWKYIHAPTPELYNVAQDPGERNNLADTHPDRVASMREQLRQIVIEAPPPVAVSQAAQDVTPEDVQRLADLGYVVTPGTATATTTAPDEAAAFDPVGPDPKDHTQAIAEMAYAMGALRSGDFALAVDLLKRMIGHGTSTPGIRRWYIEALAESGQLDEAVVEFRALLDQEPRYPEARNDFALLLGRMGHEDEAIRQYRLAIELKPEARYFRLNLGALLVRMGRADEAQEQFDTVLRTAPKDAEAINGLGNVAALRKKYREALDAYAKAIALKPTSAHFHFNRGQALFALGELPEAAEAFRGAIELNPEHVNAHVNLGNVLARERDLRGAAEQYRAALKLRPADGDVAARLTLVLSHLGDYGPAIEDLRAAVKAAPEAPGPANNLAWLLATCPVAELRDGKEAVRLAEHVCADAAWREPATLDTLAAAYAEAGRFDQAVATLEQAIEMAGASGKAAGVEEMQSRLALYKAREPYRMPSSK